MLRGAEEVFDHCRRRFRVDPKQVTRDRTFSLEEVECIGACSWAPAVQVNYDFHLDVTPEKMDKILNDYEKKTRQ
jgi:NADH-quinone oxidoreductase subunit E